jgi:RNAse (barnase) inhibitor barstar
VGVENELRDELTRLDFALFEIDGRGVDTGARLHEELARAFNFPGYYGRNWDAFNDCFDDPPLPLRSAILWQDAQRLAGADLKAFAEAITVLRSATDELSAAGRQLELFLLGTGQGFRRPTDPPEPGWRLPG